MNNDNYDILSDVLPAIDPASLTYQEWIDVGFALKDGGYSWQDWDAWSRRDPERYHDGECMRKWQTIRSQGISLGTLVYMARQQGWEPDGDRSVWKALDWDDEWCVSTFVEPPDAQQLEPLREPGAKAWRPCRQLARYLELLFDPADIVG